MNLTVTLGELLQLITTLGVGLGVIFTLRGDLKTLKALFEKHEEYDAERFEDIKDDIRALRPHNLEG